MATQTTNYGLKKPSYSDTADIGVINSNMDIIDAKMKEIDNKITNETDPTVPAWAKEPNKPTYTAEEVGALPNNTPIPDPTSVVVDRLVSVGTHIADISVNGEKTELYAPTGGGGTSVTIDSELSTTSENPVQNKVITQALNGKGTYSKPTGGIPKTDLANEVQTSLGKADTALQEHQDISGKADKTEVTALFNSISDAWDSATAYTVGQYCIYNNAIWKCLVANTNTEPTEGTHWTQTTIDAEISAVNSSLSKIETNILDAKNLLPAQQITKTLPDTNWNYILRKTFTEDCLFTASIHTYHVTGLSQLILYDENNKAIWKDYNQTPQKIDKNANITVRIPSMIIHAGYKFDFVFKPQNNGETLNVTIYSNIILTE